jgi:hypothetical protein
VTTRRRTARPAAGSDVSAALIAPLIERVLEAVIAAVKRGELPLAVGPTTAARMLGISVKALDRLDVPRVKLGHRTTVYRVKDLSAWLERQPVA